MKVRIIRVDGKVAIEADFDSLGRPDASVKLKEISEKYQGLISKISREESFYKAAKDLLHLYRIGNLTNVFRENLLKDDIRIVNLVPSISEDLGLSKGQLEYMTRFSSKYKESSLNKKFNWSAYRELIDISDDLLRSKVEKTALSRGIYFHKEIRELKKELARDNGKMF